MDANGFRVNVGKTSMIISGVGEGCAVQGSGKWPGAVCRKSVSCNSVMYSECGR